jgi:DNA polymerase-3 subunit delta
MVSTECPAFAGMTAENAARQRMVALKPSEADAFVARPSAERPIVLVFGPDAGLVHERAEKIVQASVEDVRDPFALVRLEGDALAAEPSRLVEEAHTVPLFGGRRAVWVKAGGRNFVAAVEAVVAQPPTDCRIVIEAGDLRRNAPLRAVCEKAKSAVAIPCYIDNERDLMRLVDDEMRAAKLSIAPDARSALVALIGGDRAASRSEIRKLALYAHGKASIGLDDVMAIVADASALALDAVVDAAFGGRTAETEAQVSKALTAGTSAGSILSWALRHVTQLHKARLALDDGEPPDAALRSFVPPVNFRRADAVKAALTAWSTPRLQKAMEQLAEAAFNVRRTAPLAGALTQRALLTIAQQGRRNAR